MRNLLSPKEGFLIGAHHGLDISDVDRVCALLVELPGLGVPRAGQGFRALD